MGFSESRLRGKIDALQARLSAAEEQHGDSGKIEGLKKLTADAQAEFKALDRSRD